MKLESKVFNVTHSSEMVSCVCWLGGGEVMMVSGDQLIKFNPAKNASTILTRLSPSSQPTDMKAAPSSKQAKAADIVAVACADGKLMMVKGGRVDRVVEAHGGAVLVVRWSGDGQTLATGGEDGLLKLWSPSGMLRSTLQHSNHPVYCLCFSACNSKVLFSCHKSLSIKPLQPNSNDSTWKGHDGVILCVDWNSTNNLILSAGEDCKYKIWDSYGRLIHSSAPLNFPPTSLAWSPDGVVFVVGNFHNVKLCDQTGWTHDIQRCTRGSLYGVTWSDDSTRLVAGCGCGGVLLASVVDRTLEFWPFKLQQTTDQSLTATNLTNDAIDVINLHDHVSLMSLHHKHLVITTTTKCYVYSVNNWNVPVEISIKDKNVTLVKQSSKYLLLLDSSSTCVQLYTYAGKLTSTIRHPSIHPFNHRLLAMSDDVVVLRGREDVKSVYVWDVLSGKAFCDKPLFHEDGVEEVGVDQMTSSLEKRLSLVDSKQHLYMIIIHNNQPPIKVKTGKVVDSAMWSEEASLLTFTLDTTCYLVTCPVAIFTDRNLFNLSITTIKPTGEVAMKRPSLVAFQGNRLSIRTSDGSLLQTTVPPQVIQMHVFVGKHLWTEALKLCRLVDKEYMWACLGGLSLWHRRVEQAEACYAALDQPDKVRYLGELNREPLKEVRESKLLLMMGKRGPAEGVLLQHNNIFRAILLNIQAFNWERALELALKHKSHIDTVVGHRQKYLQALGGRKETLGSFKQYAEMKVDWETIEAKMKAEYAKEK